MLYACIHACMYVIILAYMCDADDLICGRTFPRVAGDG